MSILNVILHDVLLALLGSIVFWGLVFIFWPMILIWAVNVLVPAAAIPLTWKTWFAALLVIGILGVKLQQSPPE